MSFSTHLGAVSFVAAARHRRSTLKLRPAAIDLVPGALQATVDTSLVHGEKLAISGEDWGKLRPVLAASL